MGGQTQALVHLCGLPQQGAGVLLPGNERAVVLPPGRGGREGLRGRGGGQPPGTRRRRPCVLRAPVRSRGASCQQGAGGQGQQGRCRASAGTGGGRHVMELYCVGHLCRKWLPLAGAILSHSLIFQRESSMISATYK
jgi:hypothetical protein